MPVATAQGAGDEGVVVAVQVGEDSVLVAEVAVCARGGLGEGDRASERFHHVPD